MPRGSLESIGDLEKYIDQSAVIGIFLSKSYFKSRNCLCEVVGTLQQNKPYLFMHEADPAKGGAPLEELKLELENEEHRNALFDGRRITVWHRIADFQLISLLQIAEDMLLFSPEYQLKATLPLYVPGSLLEQRLTFAEPVVLFVSDSNPGAAEAAAEMTSCFRKLSVTDAFPSTSTIQRKSRRFSMAAASATSSSTALAGSSAQATHFLLYLNQRTYMGPEGEAFATQVQDAQKAGMQIVMIHENDPVRKGCDFATFFQTTPPDLIAAGLYKALAIAFVSGEGHRMVSRALLAKALGAKGSKRGMQDVLEAAEAEASDAAQNAVGAAGAVGEWVSGGIGGALRTTSPAALRRQLSSSKFLPRIRFRKKRPPTVAGVDGGASKQEQELSRV